MCSASAARSAENGLVQQAQYDLAHIRTGRIKLKKLKVA